MKKKYSLQIIMLLLTTIFYSCSEDDSNPVTIIATKIDSIQIGEIRPAGEVTEIRTYYTLPNDCSDFYAYDYNAIGNERTVAAYIVVNSTNCTGETQAAFNTIRFAPIEAGEYDFRFWQSQNSNDGENVFLEQTINIPEQ